MLMEGEGFVGQGPGHDDGMAMRAAEAVSRMEKIIGEDVGGRGIAGLRCDGELMASASQLVDSSSVCIATGYPCCLSDPPTETDGPLGALAVARALSSLGKKVVVLTDQCNSAPIEACLKASSAAYPKLCDHHPKGSIRLVVLPPGDVGAEELVEEHGFDHLIAIERPGPASDGGYYTMRGRDMSLSVGIARVEQLWSLGIASTGIGDGGNELGMGKRYDAIRGGGLIPLGEKIGCTVGADNLIVCGVSNWGGWALSLAVGMLGGGEVGAVVDGGCEKWVLAAMVEAGARDGVTGEARGTVDGIEWDAHERLLERLRACCTL